MVAIKGSGGEFITTGSYLRPGAEAKVIVYYNKYTSMPPNTITQPHHRAFMVGGVPKVTGGSIPSLDAAAYQGNKPNNPVPNLDENAWIQYANGGGPLPADLAASYAALPGEHRITQDEFDGLAVE